MISIYVICFIVLTTLTTMNSEDIEEDDGDSINASFSRILLDNYVSIKSRTKRNVIVINDLADILLQQFKKRVLNSGDNVIHVPDILQKSTYRMFGKEMTLITFKGVRGTIRDISTIKRIGDVTMRQSERGITINMRFLVELLKYSCDLYRLEFPVFKFSGKLDADISNNEFYFQATISNKNEKCNFTLDSMKVVRLSGIKVKLTGFSVLNSLIDRFASWILKRFEGRIQNEVEKELIIGVMDAIEKTGTCTRSRHHLYTSFNGFHENSYVHEETPLLQDYYKGVT